MTTIDEMRKHIEQLIADLQCDDDVQVVWSNDETAHVLRDDRSGEVLEVLLPRIGSEVDYAVALHEFGHVHGCHQTHPNTIVREQWAWQWAREHALCWTPDMAREQTEGLEWYRTHRAD
jgi:hypothetical protein